MSDDATEVRLAGSGAIPGALVLVFNEEPTVLAGAIVTADANGRYRLTVPIDLTLSPVNQLEIWQRLGTQDSSLITFVVPANGMRGGPVRDAGAEAPAAPADDDPGDR